MSLGDWILLIIGACTISFSAIIAKDTEDFLVRAYFGLVILGWVLVIGFHFNGLLEIKLC